MKTLIRADRLIDGTGAEPVKNATLIVEDGRIVGIHSGDAGAVAGAEVLDFPGCTILPGLIDTHVHLNLPGDGATLEEALRESEGVIVAASVGNTAKALAAGITTVRDVGALRNTAFEVRRAIELGFATGARVMACGQPITITGGHTWYLGGEADGEDALRRKVRDLIKHGAEFIKVMGSGGGTVGTASWRPAFRQSEIDAIVDEAHRNERRVSIHCLCAESIDQAVRAGVDQIEHAGFITSAAGTQTYDPKVADRLAKSGIPVTGTLAVGGTVLNAMRAIEHRSQAEDQVLARWEPMMAENLAQFRKLSEAGVTFVAGTDAGWRFTSFDSLPQELELMEKGGYSRSEALHAATGRAAKVIGLDHRTGTLAKGLDADVIVVEGNPLDSLDALRDLRLILQRGESRGIAGRAAIAPQAAFCPV
jgi:imidazolonepropionase-like amidohydrolase